LGRSVSSSNAIDALPDACGVVREGLERAVMRGRDRECAALEQRLEHRLSQRRALDGIRARAELVEEDQAPLGGVLDRLGHAPQMREERAHVREDRLLVADVADHAIEPRDHAARGGRNGKPGHREEREEADRLHRDGLPAHVRPRDQEHPRLGIELQIERNRRAGLSATVPLHEERMPPAAKEHPALLGQLGNGAVTVARPGGHRLGSVEAHERVEVGFERGAVRMRPRAQIAEDPVHFGRFVEPQLGELAVGVGRVPRLDEEARPRSRVPEHRAGKRAAVGRRDGDDVAPLAQRDEALGRREGAENRLELGRELLAESADPAADPRQLGARIVLHLAARLERARDRAVEPLDGVEPAEHAVEAGRVPTGLPVPRHDVARLLEENAQPPELVSAERGALRGSTARARGGDREAPRWVEHPLDRRRP
jgi:hypothetical protein